MPRSRRATAASLGVEFVLHHIDRRRVDVAPGPNLEARLRRARYDALPSGVLTGHTADDQAETVLLNLLRGAGLDGLTAMSPGPTKPLLALRRYETVTVCEALGLAVATDPTNVDPSFRRNRIRHEALPLLADIAQRDPVNVLARTADVLRHDLDLLDGLAAELDPADARQLAAAHPRSPVAPCADGSPPTGTRPTRPRSSGCSRWPPGPISCAS